MKDSFMEEKYRDGKNYIVGSSFLIKDPLLKGYIPPLTPEETEELDKMMNEYMDEKK